MTARKEAREMGVTRGTWNLARVLGLIAGVLAWVAALIAYLKDGEVKLGLIAAGIFIAAISFAAPTKPKDPPVSGA